MSILYRRLLDGATLAPGDAPDLAGALDLGEYREVHLVLTVDSAGEGDAPTLVVQHAAVNEEGAYVDFETRAETALNATGTAWFHAGTFTRWVMWFVSGTLSAEARVTVDLIAKP